MNTITQRFKDFMLELRIKMARADMLLAAYADETRRCYRRLAGLVARRSASQIARMESKRGLA